MNLAKNNITVIEADNVPGFIYGLRSPCFRIRLQYLISDQVQIDHLDKQFSRFFPDSGFSTRENRDHPVSFLLDWIKLFNHHSAHPVFDDPKLINCPEESRAVLLLPYPCTNPDSSIYLFDQLGDLISQDEPLPGEKIQEFSLGLVKKLKMNLRYSNSPHLLKAAYHAGICVFNLDGAGTLQYGMGSSSHLMSSTLTQQSSAISANLARNKFITNTLLAGAGIPVPEQIQVRNAEHAVKASQKIGFPVVVKPVGLEGGKGVYTKLESGDEVSSAFTKAKALSSRLLVEKHIYGRDYRIVVFQGEAIFAIERAPAHVIGDGQSTIEELIAELNQQPDRNLPWSSMTKIKTDDDLLNLLRQQNMDMDSVPEPGLRVHLISKANIGAGGTPTSVMDRIHPDNLSLAERAVRALRLDLAGVDLLMEDIGVSWKDCTCGICEINAQPQLGSITSSHLYPLILNRLVPDQGRIPVHIVVGSPEATRPVLQSLTEGCNERYRTMGLYSDGAVRIDDERIGMDMNACQAGRLLIMDSSVDVIIMQVDDLSLSQSGLPFDRFSSFILCKLDSLECTDGNSARSSEIEAFIDAVSPAADQVILCDNDRITPNENWIQASQDEITDLLSL